ncbi:unnamed protein product [Rotaria sp. Silwood2]|nr:unnamed protein product [Rotaria sp. Silwood2]
MKTSKILHYNTFTLEHSKQIYITKNMSASVNTKKPCVTYNTSAGILTYDGCQQRFCGKDVIWHRQYLARQLDGIIQEQALIQYDIKQISIDSSLLKEIDQWVKESLAKIHRAAEVSRKTAQKIVKQSKGKIFKIYRDLDINLRSFHAADDYLENDLIHWIEQLKNLKLEITLPSSVKIIKDEKSIIQLIKVENTNLKNNKSTNSKQLPLLTRALNLKIQAKFVDALGPVTLKNGGFLAKHTGFYSDYIYFRGNLLYSHSHHMIRYNLRWRKQKFRTSRICQ